jgi:hypothetical protein
MYIKLGTFDLTGKVYDDIKFAGGFFDIKQDGATSLRTGARKGDPKGFSASFFVCFATEAEASAFMAYVAPYSPEDPDFDEEVGADTALYLRTSDWYYRAWGVVVKPTAIGKSPLDYTQYMYDVTCYLYSPYSYARRPSTWLQSGITSLPVTKSISNRNGHIASAFDSLAVTCAYNAAHVKNLVHSIGSTSLTIATEALSDEIWELKGNEYKILETYEDLITSGTKWGHDWTGSGTFDTDHIELNNGQSAYIRLSGPNPILKPIVMTADLSLDSGGATGQATIDISSDAVSWETVLDQDDFQSGSYEYVLSGTEYMTDVYVRITCTSGTSGKYVNIGSIKFDVERWVEYGAVPQIAAGSSGTATVDATTGSEYCNIDGEFYTRRKFL